MARLFVALGLVGAVSSAFAQTIVVDGKTISIDLTNPSLPNTKHL